MSIATQLLTADNLWNMPDHGGHAELVRGELRLMSPAGPDHGFVSMNLSAPLHQDVRRQKLGIVVAAETGFIISRDPDTVRAPDGAFIRKDRIPQAGIPQKFWVGAPDLAIETTSPNDTHREIGEKVQDWLTAGTRLVWVVSPLQKTVIVHRPDWIAQSLHVGDTLDGGNVVPGFQIQVAEIFEE